MHQGSQAQASKLQEELEARNSDLQQLRDQLREAKSSIRGLNSVRDM